MSEKKAHSVDLKGRRIGRLLVVERAPPIVTYNPDRIRRRAAWRCLCDCGTEIVATACHLKIGHSRSCGCLNRELAADRKRTHNMTGTIEYSRWCGMYSRCYLAQFPQYKDYGGRGIFVCERWRHNFEAFYADMGPCPSPKHTLERKDNDGPYSPENCRWATQREQANNKRTNTFLTVGGRRMTTAQWSHETGLPRDMIARRIVRGWSPEDAVTIKPRAVRKWYRCPQPSSTERQSAS